MINLRPAILTDLPALTEIYNEAIANTTATFDTEPKTVSQRLDWFKAHDKTRPLMAAFINDTLVGWATLSRWSDRAAYDGTAELSVYVHFEYRGRGIGKKLMEVIIAEGKLAGLHTLLSRITKGNNNSIHLHEILGFETIGTMKEVGLKFGKLLDVIMMQKML